MKILNLPHKKCDYTCMWNGFEDYYEWKTGNRAPEYMFFGLSGFCNFVYLKQKNADCKRMIYWSNGLTRKMYDFMEEIIGYSYKIIEGNSFEYALGIAKKNIDNGNPIILGALDMFYLPYYEKYFNKIHIPIHHILMIGYDEVQRKIYLHDCGKDKIESLDYDNLKDAWNINLPGFSKKNTIFEVQFNNEQNNIEQIVKKGLIKKCEINLKPPVSIFGIPAMRKFGKEIVKWKEEFCNSDYKKVLYHLVEYTGFPPTLPIELIEDEKINKNEIPNNHRGARDKFSDLLNYFSNKFNINELRQSSILFEKSGILIEKLTKDITEYIIKENKNDLTFKEQIMEIADIEEKAYMQISNVIK
jgi:hypothetical protein